MTHGIKVVNIKDKPRPDFDLYIGRENKWLYLKASKWANPEPLKNESDREANLQRYKNHVENNPILLNDLPELKGLVLGCYCNSKINPKRCHGHILIELYEKYVKE